MADVEAIVLVAGEVRQVQKKRDFTDTVTGEVRVGKGRKVEVLTFGGFLTLSVGEAFDAEEFAEGQVILVKARVLPWVIPARTENGQSVGSARFGTAFIYDGVVSPEQLDAVVPELAGAGK